MTRYNGTKERHKHLIGRLFVAGIELLLSRDVMALENAHLWGSKYLVFRQRTDLPRRQSHVAACIYLHPYNCGDGRELLRRWCIWACRYGCITDSRSRLFRGISYAVHEAYLRIR